MARKPATVSAVIHVGAANYVGLNKLTVCDSKAEAVRELHMRGFTRDRAREIVNNLCSTLARTFCDRNDEGTVIEARLVLI